MLVLSTYRIDRRAHERNIAHSKRRRQQAAALAADKCAAAGSGVGLRAASEGAKPGEQHTE
jgi:hypothetical protein